MNRIFLFVTIFLFIFIIFIPIYEKIPIANAVTSDNTNDTLEVTFQNEQGQQKFSIPLEKVLFKPVSTYDLSGNINSITWTLKSNTTIYKEVGFSKPNNKIVFVYPIFTQAAYSSNGFYDYYKKKCDISCTTISIPNSIIGRYSSSVKANTILKLLNYSSISDIDIDKNPAILKKYDKVIVLHNEYVTQKEFDAITSHPNVVYLYPNSLYAIVKTDYNKNTVSLVRGHGYPDQSIKNGFSWKYDNSQFEYDIQCNNWKFSNIPHGKMLNCYPDYRILYDKLLLKSIRN